MGACSVHRLAICSGGARAVDVQINGLLAILVLQVQELCHNELCDCWHQLQKKIPSVSK